MRTGSRMDHEKDTRQNHGQNIKRTKDKSELYDKIQRGGDKFYWASIEKSI
jgi:hypothetical protein